MKLNTLKARITSADYEIDARAVAEAMLGRPSARLWVIPDAVLVPGATLAQSRVEPGRGAGSGDVLEAS